MILLLAGIAGLANISFAGPASPFLTLGGGLHASSFSSIPNAFAGDPGARGPLAPGAGMPVNPFQDVDYVPSDGSKHLARGLTELAILEFIPWALARWIRDFPTPEDNWAKVDPDTWWRNISKGYEYDTDNFVANHVGHPYHGALFFNAGRVNGYDFYESAAFSLGGSVVWEFFGETYRPSFNDWIYTGLGGANLGEILYRLSTMITDNTATGGRRVWQEIGGAIVNPVRGFNRLITGETARNFPNPEWRTPSKFRVTMDAGARALDKNGDMEFPDKEIDATFVLGIAYGDEFRVKEPFSEFTLRVALATGDQHLAGINSSGFLFGTELEHDRHRLDVNLEFDYNNLNLDVPQPGDSVVFKGIVYGSVTFNPRLLSRFELSKEMDLVTDAGVALAPIASTPDDYYMDSTSGGGRNYDFGQGVGPKVGAGIRSGGWEYVSLRYQGLWIFTQSEPADSRHHIHFLLLAAQLPLNDYFTIGVEIGRYWRESVYDTYDDVNRVHSLGRLFFRTAIVNL
jgi:hypothetical protein